MHPASLPKALCPTQHAIQKPNLQTNHAHQKPCYSGAHPSTPVNANPAIQKPAALATTPPTCANLQLEAHKFLPKALRPTQHVIQKPAPCKATRPTRNSDPPICAILEPFNPPRNPAVQKPTTLATSTLPTCANPAIRSPPCAPNTTRPSEPRKQARPTRNPDQPFNPPRSMQTLPSRSPQPFRPAPSPHVQTLHLEAHPASLPKALCPTQHVIQKPAPCKQTRPGRNSDHVNQKPSASRGCTPPVPRTNHLKCIPYKQKLHVARWAFFKPVQNKTPPVQKKKQSK